MTDRETRVFDSAEALSAAAADAFCALAHETLAARPVFRVALAGGSTPKQLYRLLVDRPLDWTRLRLFWGDERNVPLDHPESNYRMVREALLEPAEVPAASCFPVPVDPAEPAATAARYERTLREQFARQSDVPAFDLVLLGMGPDAHTASLFPGTAALAERERLYVENWVPKLDTWRLTATVPLINAARNVWFFVAGGSKKPALEQVWHGPRDPDTYPSQLVDPDGQLVWWLDQEAEPKSEQPPRA